MASVRKTILFLALAALAAGSAFSAVRFEAGFYLGVRSLNFIEFGRSTGSSLVYSPTASVFLSRNIFCGAAYEGGHLGRVNAGIPGESAKLDVSGIEVFAGYQPWTRPFVPYIKAGFGSYSYKYAFDNPSLKAFGADGTKAVILIGGGLKIFLFRFLFLGGEFRYFPLTVKSRGVDVDIGGTRILGGIGVFL